VFDQMVVDMPESPSHRFNLAISLMQLKRHKEAVVHLEKVVEVKPDYGAGYQQLAACYNETGQYSKAIGTLRKGIETTEKKAAFYCTWGRSLEKMGLHDEAIDMFQRAVSDQQWGSYAKKQIKRQNDLKKRAEMIREQG
jgi:tetratricopeptide (TPR) repeat protein